MFNIINKTGPNKIMISLTSNPVGFWNGYIITQTNSYYIQPLIHCLLTLFFQQLKRQSLIDIIKDLNFALIFFSYSFVSIQEQEQEKGKVMIHSQSLWMHRVI